MYKILFWAVISSEKNWWFKLCEKISFENFSSKKNSLYYKSYILLCPDNYMIKWKWKIILFLMTQPNKAT